MSHDEETLYLTLNCVYLIAVSRANGTVLWKSRESPHVLTLANNQLCHLLDLTVLLPCRLAGSLVSLLPTGR